MLPLRLSLTFVLAIQSAIPLWDHFQDVADVGPGRLLSMLLDVDGDGRTEIFLTASQACGNAGCVWQVYSPAAAPNRARYLGEAAFPAGGFRWSPAARALTSCWHLSAFECELIEFRVVNGMIVRRGLGLCRSADSTCQTELGRIGQWQRQSGVPVFESNIPATLDLTALTWSRQGSAARRGDLPDFDALAVTSDR
jgi:hypothetical protein